MSATVRRDGGRWHVSFTVEVERVEWAPARPSSVVGVDVGIKHLAVLSTGELVDDPRRLVDSQQRMRTPGAGTVPQDQPRPAHRPTPVETLGTRRSPAWPRPRPGGQPAP
jgi:hypothetical protein